jgi:hypothetical protein
MRMQEGCYGLEEPGDRFFAKVYILICLCNGSRVDMMASKCPQSAMAVVCQLTAVYAPAG